MRHQKQGVNGVNKEVASSEMGKALDEVQRTAEAEARSLYGPLLGEMYYTWNQETGEIRPCTLGRFAETFHVFEKKIVRQDRLPRIYPWRKEGAFVSTVFLGIAHGHYPGTDPVLFETMIFGGVRDGYQVRYTRETAARAGHRVALRWAWFWTLFGFWK